MNCSNCNKELKNDTVFCRCCGAKLNPSDLDLLDKSLHKLDMEFYIKRADKLAIERKFYDALEYYAKALELDFDNANIYNARGKCYSHMLCCQRLEYKYQEALEDFTKALELNPGDIQTTINIGHARIGLKEYEDAIETFSIVLEKDRLNI